MNKKEIEKHYKSHFGCEDFGLGVGDRMTIRWALNLIKGLPKQKKPSAISRSVYQKVCEENKRLENDIRILVGPHNIFYSKVFKKWSNKFKDDQAFHEMMKDFAVQYIEEHPEVKMQMPNFKQL